MLSSLARLFAAALSRDDRTLPAAVLTESKVVRILASEETPRQKTGLERVISAATVFPTEVMLFRI
jgi:hypothetical protein